MMIDVNFRQTFLRAESIGVIAIVFYSALVALVFAIDNLVSDDPIFDLPGAIALGGGYSLFFGLPAVVFYGAPVFSAYLMYRSFRFRLVMLLALIPGAVLLVFDQAIGVFAIVGGAIVALCMRYIAIRWFGYP